MAAINELMEHGNPIIPENDMTQLDRIEQGLGNISQRLEELTVVIRNSQQQTTLSMGQIATAFTTAITELGRKFEELANAIQHR